MIPNSSHLSGSMSTKIREVSILRTYYVGFISCCQIRIFFLTRLIRDSFHDCLYLLILSDTFICLTRYKSPQ